MSAHNFQKRSRRILISMSTPGLLGVKNSNQNHIRELISTEFAAIHDNQLYWHLNRSTQRVSLLFHKFWCLHIGFYVRKIQKKKKKTSKAIQCTEIQDGRHVK